MEFLILFLFAIIFGIVGYAIGKPKGDGAMGCLVSVVLGPIGWLIVALSKGRKIKCKFCKEYIQPDALVCPHCQKDLNVEETKK